MHSIPSHWNQAFVRGDCNGPTETAEKTCRSAASNSKGEVWFWPLAEFLVLSSRLSDVGLCPRALGSGSGAVQMGPPCHLHPRLSGKAAFGNCQVERPCEISRVSGASAKRRAGPAGADPQDPLCPERRAKHRQLDGPVAQGGHELSRNTQGGHRHCKHQSRYKFTRVSSRNLASFPIGFPRLPLEESVEYPHTFKGWRQGEGYIVFLIFLLK